MRGLEKRGERKHVDVFKVGWRAELSSIKRPKTARYVYYILQGVTMVFFKDRKV